MANRVDEMKWHSIGKLLENAFDNLEACVKILSQEGSIVQSRLEESELKALAVNIGVGLELLYKVKIVGIDWKQLFVHPDKATESKWCAENFTSVGLGDCLKRIESISTITFTVETKHLVNIIANLRKKGVHYYHSTAEYDNTLSIVYRGIDTFIEFYRQYLFADIYEETDKTATTDKRLARVKGYPEIRIQTLRKKYSAYDIPRTYYYSECGTCLQDVFVLKDCETVLCIYCGSELIISEDASRYSSYEQETKQCVKCGRNSMTANHKASDELEAWDCIICGYFVNKSRKWSDGYKTISTTSLKDECKNMPPLALC